MKQSEVEKIDTYAIEIMKAIVQGIYGNPHSLEMLHDIATQNKQSLNQEIVERSYTLANTMIKFKSKYVNNVEG